MRQGYQEAVERIYEREKFRGRISLQPIQELTSRLGNPERDFPSVHVAGTNGKGSTATLIASVLQEEGLKTGLFTSPHLVDFRERIRINRGKISREEVVESHERIEETGVELSFFECTAGMAFDHFSREEVDIAVVETGMGGRLDATNVVEPELSVITNVAEEHTRWLGETPEQIAYELAGIVKEGVPTVSGAEGKPAEVIGSVADEKGSPLVRVSEEVEKVPDDRLELSLRRGNDVVRTGLVGDYQVDNVNTVVSACRALDRDISSGSITSALEEVRMPGRMEVVSRKPLFLLDGAHNPAAFRRLEDTLSGIDTGKTVAVVSILADKEYGEMLSVLERHADLVLLSEAGIGRAADPEELASCMGSVDREVVRSIPQALDTAMESVSEDDTVLVTGSMYFVGDVKKALGGDPHFFS